jgi:hypothetical protein
MGLIDVSAFVRASIPFGSLALPKFLPSQRPDQRELIPTALVKTACGSGRIGYGIGSLTAGELEITRSFNTFSTFQSSIREVNLTCLASGAICVPLCGFYDGVFASKGALTE